MSMEKWAHYNPVRFRFGRGCRSSLKEILEEQRVLIVCSPRGRKQLESDSLLGQAICSVKSLIWMDSVETNPDLNRLQDLINDLQDLHLDCIVAFGGGSAIDSAKAFSLALSPPARHHSLRKLLDEVASLPMGIALPLYVIPTTAGTGSEVTPYATVWDHSERRKLSLAGQAVYPHTAIVDSELSDNVPYEVTLNTGLDAINQAAESIWNRNMTPMSEMLAHKALKKGMVALPRLLKDLKNPNLRDTMAEVSLIAGLAISQTRTSLCHAISYPLTAHFGIPHGLACAFTMPAVLIHNQRADDGRFSRLESILNSNMENDGFKRLAKRFEELNSMLLVASKIRSVIGNLDVLLSLKNEMFTPGRVDNGLTNITNDSLDKILQLSWKS